MKKILFYLVFSVLLNVPCKAQTEYINLKYSLGYLSTVITGIYPTDSCLYVKGVMVDTLFRYGTFFSKVSLDGQFVHTSELIDSSRRIESWLPRLIKNPAGNFVVAGYMYDPEDAGFLAEFTPNGTLVRFNQFRSPDYPAEKFIVITAIMNGDSNSYIITGNLGAVPKDIYLAKINNNLEIDWLKTYGGNLKNNSASLLKDTDGGIIFGGMEYTNLNFHSIICRKTITKVNNDGSNLLWDWKLPEESLPPMRGWLVNDMIKLSDGSIVGASAISKEEVINEGSSLLLHSPSIFKLKPNHTLDWETPIGNGLYIESYQEFTRILNANSAGDGYVAAGSMYLLDTTGSGISIQLGVLAHVAENGDSLWMRYQYYYGDSTTSRLHNIYDLAPANGGGYWICGDAIKQVPGEPLQQGWLLRVDDYGCLVPGCQLVSTNPEVAIAEKIKLYPNPASDHLAIYHAGYNFCQGRFRIVDLQGRVLQEWRTPASDLTTIFDLSQFVSGTFFLQYTEKGELLTNKAFSVIKG